MLAIKKQIFRSCRIHKCAKNVWWPLSSVTFFYDKRIKSFLISSHIIRQQFIHILLGKNNKCKQVAWRGLNSHGPFLPFACYKLIYNAKPGQRKKWHGCKTGNQPYVQMSEISWKYIPIFIYKYVWMCEHMAVWVLSHLEICGIQRCRKPCQYVIRLDIKIPKFQ